MKINIFSADILDPLLKDIAFLGAISQQETGLGEKKIKSLCRHGFLTRVSTPYGTGYTLGPRGAQHLGKNRSLRISSDKVANELIRRKLLPGLKKQGFTIKQILSSSLMIMDGPHPLFVSSRHNPVTPRGVRYQLRRYYGDLVLNKGKLMIATSNPNRLRYIQDQYEDLLVIVNLTTPKSKDAGILRQRMT